MGKSNWVMGSNKVWLEKTRPWRQDIAAGGRRVYFDGIPVGTVGVMNNRSWPEWAAKAEGGGPLLPHLSRQDAVVALVATHLRRHCSHNKVKAGDNFCAQCGVWLGK